MRGSSLVTYSVLGRCKGFKSTSVALYDVYCLLLNSFKRMRVSTSFVLLVKSLESIQL